MAVHDDSVPPCPSSRGVNPSAVRILEIGCYPPPFNGWGTRIAFVRRALEARGCSCVPLNIGESRHIPSRDYECVRSGREYIFKLWSYLRRGYLPHVHTNGDGAIKGLLLCGMAYLLCLFFLRRPVLTFHAGTKQTYFPRTQSRFMAPVFKLMFHAPQAVICNNQDVKKLIVEYGVDAGKVVPIAPFSRQYLDDVADQLPTSTQAFCDKHRPVILTYVECRPEYALDVLFKALAEVTNSFPHVGVVVVGAGSDRDALQSLLCRHSLQSRTLHLGAVDHDVFLALLNKASIYVRSNQREGTSSSIREALHLGIDIVADDTGDHPDGVVVYPWGNGTQLVAAILEVLRKSRSPRECIEMHAIPDTVAEEADLLMRCALETS